MYEINTNQLPLARSITRDLACNLGTGTHWESNPLPFALRDDAEPTEPHQSGLLKILKTVIPSFIRLQ